MNISFVPSACKGEDAKFDGQMVVRLPSAEERCEYLAESNMDFSDIKESGKSATTRFYKPIGILMKKSYDHIVKVDLKKKADGKKISTVDDMRFDPDCFAILTELATMMSTGNFVMGKTS